MTAYVITRIPLTYISITLNNEESKPRRRQSCIVLSVTLAMSINPHTLHPARSPERKRLVINIPRFFTHIACVQCAMHALENAGEGRA